MAELIRQLALYVRMLIQSRIGSDIARAAATVQAEEALAAAGTAAANLTFFSALAVFLGPAIIMEAPRFANNTYKRWIDNSRELIGNAVFDPILPFTYIIAVSIGVVRSLSALVEYKSRPFVRFYQNELRMERFDTSGILSLFRKNIGEVEVLKRNLGSLGWQDEDMDALLRTAYETPGAGQILQGLLRGNYDEAYARSRLRELGLQEEDQTLLVSLTHAEFTIDQLLTMRLKGYMNNDEFFYAFGKRLGYDKGQLDILEASNGEPISIGQSLDLWNKKEGADLAISLGLANEIERDWATGKGEADVNRAVVEGPLNNYWFPAIKKLRYQMLGAPDYIRFAVRDVYNAAVRAANRLDEGFPEIVGAKLRMLGYSPQDAKDAWAAHWELPSPTQVFEMLHRGKLPAGITVDDYLASADYAPAWRQSLSDISYNPITRTDAKRMYKLRGDFDELVRHFKDNGYSNKDALDLAEFTRDDVNIEGNNERRGITSGLKNAVVSMYKNRMIDADEVRSILRSMTYTDETIEQFITEADFFRIQDEKSDVASALKNAYVKALRSREDTVALLGAAGWRGQPLDNLMGTWDLLRTSTELQPHQSTSRDLTKAELISAFGDGLLDEQQLTDALLQLGYDESEAAVLVQHSVLKKKKEDTALLVELTHQRYLGREISVDEASIALDKLQVPVTQKSVSLKKWQVEREKRVPDFTVAQLEGMIKAKVMEEDTARTFLRDQGYMDSQIAYLLAWWSGKRTPPTSDTKMTRLSRSDLESMYIGDKTKRKTVHDAFVSLGYTSDEADFILDGIDRNLKRS